MATATGARERLTDLDQSRLEVGLVAVYFVGLLFYSYPALVVFVDGVRVFRPDWLLSLPVLAHVVFAKRKVVVTRPAVWAFGFLTVALASAMASGLTDATQFLTVFVQLAYAIGLFVALASLRPGFDAFRAMLRVWVLLLSALAVYAIYQAAAFELGLPFADPYLLEAPNNFRMGFQMGGYARPAAVFEEPSWFASALVTGVALLVPCVASSRPVLFSRAGQFVALVALVAAVVISGSLSGYLTLAAATGLFFAIPLTRRFAATAVVAMGAVLLVGMGFAIALDVGLLNLMKRRVDRVAMVLTGGLSPGGGSIHVRYARYLAALRAWASAPLLGVGFGQYQTWAEANSLPEIGRLIVIDRPLSSIHGVWFEVLATTGTAGLAAFAGTWLTTLREEIATLVAVEGVEHTLVLAVLAMTLVQLVDWTWGFSVAHPYRWGLIGLGLGYVLQTSKTVQQ